MTDKVFRDSTFDEQVLQSKIPVLIDFWAEWCPPCKIIAPIIEKLAQEYSGKCVVGKMNVDENPQMPDKYTVMSLPTIMIFKNGEPIQSMIGAKSRQAYIDEIEKALGT